MNGPHSPEPVSVRWILLHMIEETARHNGRISTCCGSSRTA
jgi:hypothetical protein